MGNDIHIIQKTKCSIGTIALRNDKVLTLHPFEDVTTVNLQQLKEMHEIFMEITQGVPHLYYSDNTILHNWHPLVT